MLGVSYDSLRLSLHAVCLVDLLRYGPPRSAYCFNFSGQVRACPVTSSCSNRALLVLFLNRRREYLLLGAPFFARLFDFEIVGALDRLDGLGGVW